jgi:ParB family chromosome partitioning protein
MLRAGHLSAGHARVLVSVTDSALQEALAEQIVEKGMSVRATEEFVREGAEEERKTAKPRSKKGANLSETEIAQIRDLTNRLRSHFGTQIAIKHESGKGGRIEIAYYSEEDLERLIELLLDLD